MPELKNRKKKEVEPVVAKTKRSEVVSAYSEEGQQRNKSDRRKLKIMVGVGIGLYVVAAVVAIILFVVL